MIGLALAAILFRCRGLRRESVLARLSTFGSEKQMSHTIPGIAFYEDSNGRHVAFAEGLPAQTFNAFLDAMMKDRLEFSLYDPRYPSPSDPGAYLSYSPQKGRWRMTLGNHGWSGGIYDIEASVVARQLVSLYTAKQLSPLGLDNVCFFSQYEPESQERNKEMNNLLEHLHE